MNMNMTTGSYGTDIAAAIGESRGSVERLMPQLRMRCLDLAISSADGGATDGQILTRAEAFAVYIQTGVTPGEVD